MINVIRIFIVFIALAAFAGLTFSKAPPPTYEAKEVSFEAVLGSTAWDLSAATLPDG